MSTRRQTSSRRRTERTAALALVAVMAIGASPAVGDPGQEPGTADGGGHIHGVLEVSSVEGAPEMSCMKVVQELHSDPNHETGVPDPAYGATYTARDDAGVAHAYSGPISTRISLVSYENMFNGNFADSSCSGPIGVPVPIDSARTVSDPKGSLSCTYNTAENGEEPQSTYVHVGDTFRFDLYGKCTVTDAAGSATASVHEVREGVFYLCDCIPPDQSTLPPRNAYFWQSLSSAP